MNTTYNHEELNILLTNLEYALEVESYRIAQAAIGVVRDLYPDVLDDAWLTGAGKMRLNCKKWQMMSYARVVSASIKIYLVDTREEVKEEAEEVQQEVQPPMDEKAQRSYWVYLLSKAGDRTEAKRLYRKYSLECHPDTGGKTEWQVALNAAWEAWK